MCCLFTVSRLRVLLKKTFSVCVYACEYVYEIGSTVGSWEEVSCRAKVLADRWLSADLAYRSLIAFEVECLGSLLCGSLYYIVD
jgi:hypothetical protein